MNAPRTLQKAEKFEIEAYKTPHDIRTLSKTHAPYTGSPQKHPLDPEQIILVSDPYNAASPYIEFNRQDITHVEKLAAVVNLKGDTVYMIRVWVRRGSLATQCTPFQVTPF